MVASISASRFVTITPSVVSAGGTGLDLCGLILTQSTRIPIGTVKAFSTPEAVGAFFGLSSSEYLRAVRYFKGFNNSGIKPAQLLFMQYASVAVPAYLQGGKASVLTIPELQALSGTLSLNVDGRAVTSGAIDLGMANSFSAAATIMTTALNDFDALATASTTSGSNVLTVSAVSSGVIAVGQSVSGAGIPAGTTIEALGTGTGEAGTYIMSANATATGAAVAMSLGQTVVTFDSISGSFFITGGQPGPNGSITVAADGALSTGLLLTAATGAVTSQGSAAMTPAGAMTAAKAQTQNWASFTHLWAATADDMVAFAAWNNAMNNRFIYAQWDSAVALTTSNYAATGWGRIQAAGYAAVLPHYDPTSPVDLAVAAMGMLASIDFTATNGRTNLAYLAQDGLTPGVSSDDVAAQLEANKVNYYGYTSIPANNDFDLYFNGAVSGDFAWSDTLVNQIWMTNKFQLSLFTLLTIIHSIPYSPAGYTLVEETLGSDIDDALNFGAIRTGVTLSAEQSAAIKATVGVDVSSTLETTGWYLQVADPGAAVRAARGSPIIHFFYMDGGSIQHIALNSAEVQ